MKWLLLCACCKCLCIHAQEISSVAEQQLESIVATEDIETEDDTYLQQLEGFRKHPVNLNTASRDELNELRILNDLQIESLLTYRSLLGPIINVYELQAVPGWSISMIRKLLPFITITQTTDFEKEFKKQLKEGQHTFLIRAGQLVNSDNKANYLGGPLKLLFRYRYQYSNQLQYGLTAEKDAGEQFLKGTSRGFDFYSFHLFIRRKGLVRSIAIGDFVVNMGQGLIQWQSLAFKKSAATINIKRQSPVLRPYTSSGEFNFHRGIGITLKKNKLELTAFVSLRQLSANLDTIDKREYFTSFQVSGLHRTINEISNRNNLRQLATGGSLHYRHNRLSTGINAVLYNYSAHLQKQDELYDLFAPTGNYWYNLSVDYDYLYRNLHLFGEAAVDKNFNTALLNGLIITADPKVDISLLYRRISPRYQSIQSNAFTENTVPANENGFYTGICIRPTSIMEIHAYADIYSIPWLTYSIHKPSTGKDFFIQLNYNPSKQTELYSRFSNEIKAGSGRKQQWRTHINYVINSSFTLRKRTELSWYTKENSNKKAGFLSYIDLLYKPKLKPVAVLLRAQYFETDDYDSRIYAWENDVLYSYSIPAFYNKGYRLLLNLQYDLNKKISFWFRVAKFLHMNESTEYKLQVRVVIH